VINATSTDIPGVRWNGANCVRWNIYFVWDALCRTTYLQHSELCLWVSAGTHRARVQLLGSYYISCVTGLGGFVKFVGETDRQQ
jgi:hypothetical protein